VFQHVSGKQISFHDADELEDQDCLSHGIDGFLEKVAHPGHISLMQCSGCTDGKSVQLLCRLVKGSGIDLKRL
jgi:hypothetical protein